MLCHSCFVLKIIKFSLPEGERAYDKIVSSHNNNKRFEQSRRFQSARQLNAISTHTQSKNNATQDLLARGCSIRLTHLSFLTLWAVAQKLNSASCKYL